MISRSPDAGEALEPHSDDRATFAVMLEGGFEMLAIATRLENERTLSGSPPGWLDRIQEQIHDCFREGLTLTDLTEVAGVHRRLRLSWARRQLESEDDRLSDVALAAGFANQAHFMLRAISASLNPPSAPPPATSAWPGPPAGRTPTPR